MLEPEKFESSDADFVEQLMPLAGPLRAFFRRRIENATEVDDLVQELFCRLIERNEAVPIRFSTTYVFQAAANLLRDRARRGHSWVRARAQWSHDSENNVEEISPERVLLARDMVARVLKALEMLPERTQVVFLLHRYEGMKYREIAQRFGVSESSIEKHMIAAIQHLAIVMGRER
jgi:RNA polymerase sigma-70 factor (ECF subfamily)